MRTKADEDYDEARGLIELRIIELHEVLDLHEERARLLNGHAGFGAVGDVNNALEKMDHALFALGDRRVGKRRPGEF